MFLHSYVLNLHRDLADTWWLSWHVITRHNTSRNVNSANQSPFYEISLRKKFIKEYIFKVLYILLSLLHSFTDTVLSVPLMIPLGGYHAQISYEKQTIAGVVRISIVCHPYLTCVTFYLTWYR